MTVSIVVNGQPFEFFEGDVSASESDLFTTDPGSLWIVTCIDAAATDVGIHIAYIRIVPQAHAWQTMVLTLNPTDIQSEAHWEGEQVIAGSTLVVGSCFPATAHVHLRISGIQVPL